MIKEQLKDMNKEKLKSMATSLFQKSKDKLWSFGSKKPAA
jgi:hypothetical protein